MAPTVLALFAGYGGLELGLDAALGGARTVGYVEREAHAAAILLARMEEQTLEPAPIWAGDIRDMDATPFQGVDWITGGFPCQPFSAAGKRQGQDDERWLWDDIVRVIREVQPRWLLFENVPGLVRLGLGPVLRDLAVLGFDAEWDLFEAAQVGASHKRQRVFILARSVGNSEHERELPVSADPRRETPRRSDVASTSHTLSDDARRDPLAREKVAGNGFQHSDLADAEGQRRQGDRETGLRPFRPEHDGRSDELADAGRELLEGRGGSRDRNCGRSAVGRRLFAPGPADLDVWARVLTETPEVEPSLCRMADGASATMVYRQDRLRALGNGVVPLQAAVAVRVLADRAGWDLPRTRTDGVD